MYYKGNSVELIVDELPGEVMSVERLAIYRRSRHLQIIKSSDDFTPHHSLRDVDPRPLWNFPGHPLINDDWFKAILLFDSGGYKLVVDAVIVDDAEIKRDPVVRYETGEFIIQPGARMVVGEAGLTWCPELDNELHEKMTDWGSVHSILSRHLAGPPD